MCTILQRNIAFMEGALRGLDGLQPHGKCCNDYWTAIITSSSLSYYRYFINHFIIRLFLLSDCHAQMAYTLEQCTHLELKEFTVAAQQWNLQLPVQVR